MTRSKMKAVKKQVKKQEVDQETKDRLTYLGNLDEEEEAEAKKK